MSVELVIVGHSVLHRVDRELTDAIHAAPAHVDYVEMRAHVGAQVATSWWRQIPELDAGEAAACCNYIRGGKPVAREAAPRKKLCRACYPPVDPYSHPLARADYTGRSRAFLHALECEVCWTQGMSRCEVLPRIAMREIDGDLDPRLDPGHAAAAG